MNHYAKIELDLLSIPKTVSYYAVFILYLEKQYFTTVFMYMYLYVVMLYSITPKIYCIQIVDLIACGCTNTNSLPTQYFFITPVCFVLSIFFIHVSNNKYVFPCTIYLLCVFHMGQSINFVDRVRRRVFCEGRWIFKGTAFAYNFKGYCKIWIQ